MIGVGADHRHLAAGKPAEPRRVVGRRLGLIVEQAGADHEIGLFRIRELHLEAFEDRAVALGAEMEHLGRAVLAKLMPGEIAGCDDRVISIVGDADAADLLLDRGAWPGRVGQQHHDAAFVAEAARGGDGAVMRLVAVMQNTPDIDQPG